MKKIISSIMVMVVLFNFIFCPKNYAIDIMEEVPEESMNASSIVNDSTATAGEDNESSIEVSFTGVLKRIPGAIAATLVAALNIFPGLLQACMSILVSAGSTIYDTFSIEKTVFNEFGLFNINYFNTNNTYKIGMGNHTKTVKAKTEINLIKKAVAKYFVIFRLIASAISLLILIYVGIRMAMSTLSEDKAKYKKMLMAWVESILILFFMQYIIGLIFFVGELFSNIIYELRETVNGTSFETTIIDSMFSTLILTSGWTYVLYSIVYWFLVGIQTKFFISYFKRVIVVGFLIMIAPFVTVTYPLDKIGDGNAQAFKVWLNELMMNVFIQPIHALIYLIFIYTAGDIAKYSIFVAAIFLLSMTKVEKIVLQLFNLKNVTSLRPVDDERKK